VRREKEGADQQDWEGMGGESMGWLRLVGSFKF